MMRKKRLFRPAALLPAAGILMLPVTAGDSLGHEEIENNLSMPVVLAEGIGLTGQWSDIDPGLSHDDVWLDVYCVGDEPYYPQQTGSIWSADWQDGGGSEVLATVDWGSEVTEERWDVKSVIPVTVTLWTELAEPLTKYNMYTHNYGLCPEVVDDPLMAISSEEDEEEVIWGTDGSTDDSDEATVFTPCAHLEIERFVGLSEETPPAPDDKGDVIFASSVQDGFGVHGKPDWYVSSIDGEGRLLYLFNLNVARQERGSDTDKSGWYRLTFSLDDVTSYALVRGRTIIDFGLNVPENGVGCKVTLNGLHESDQAEGFLFEPVMVDQESVLDIYISPMTTGE